MESSTEINYQVKLECDDKTIMLNDNTFSLSGNLSLHELDELINAMLSKDFTMDSQHEYMNFNYFINGIPLMDTLHMFCTKNSISNESEIVIKYIKKRSPAKFNSVLNMPDWICAFDLYNQYKIVSCFDGNCYIYQDQLDKPIANILNNTHNTNGDTKLLSNDTNKVYQTNTHLLTECDPQNSLMFFASDSDNNIHLYELSLINSKITNLCKYIGHEQPIQTLALNKNTNIDIMASGSDDRMLKLWNIFPKNHYGDNDDDTTLPNKRQHSSQTLSTAPIITFSGHNDRITKVLWINDEEIVTSSWDLSMRFWDLNKKTIKLNISTQHALNDISINSNSSTTTNLITASNKSVQMWDIRSRSITQTFSSIYRTLVTQVCWSPINSNEILSGAHYGSIAIWDIRNNKIPVSVLHKMRGKLFSLEAYKNEVFFGGDDCKLYNFTL